MAGWPENLGRACRAAAAAAVFWAAAFGADAQVLDIDEHGTVVVFNGPTQHLSPDIRVAQPIPRSGAQRRAAPLATGPVRGGAPASRAVVSAAIRDAARRQDLDAALIAAVARTESGLDNRAVSAKGAVGVMQLMPETARSLGVDPADPEANVRGGAAYLRQLLRRYDGDIVKALAAYNAGPGAVDRHNRAPHYAETQGYIAAVMERMAQSVAPTTRPAPGTGAVPAPPTAISHGQRP